MLLDRAGRKQRGVLLVGKMLAYTETSKSLCDRLPFLGVAGMHNL